ncbi:MAG: hypothetical protein KZQ81_17680 [Candidatus Thiodiazotropha sp. (ex Rostrolucina anterorostrata)]|nr:hypothetical protein [Candidatus Thiodiazotropha sp. (ex Rostrolucina anterorostrata)]
MFGISNKKQLSQLNEQLLEKASQIEALEAQLTSLREENGQLQKQLGDHASEQHAQKQLLGNFVALGDSFNELQHSLAHTASNMKDEKLNAIRGSEISSQAIASVKVMNSEIDSVTHISQESSDSVVKLSTIADKISDFVTIIQGISEQTNLLALNAAIEAASYN